MTMGKRQEMIKGNTKGKIAPKSNQKKIKTKTKNGGGQPPKQAGHLSTCAAAYALTLCDPFNKHGVGVPKFPSMPSLKSWAFARGTFATGSAGLGYIICSPTRMIANDAVGSGVSPITYSDASYAGTTLNSVIPTAGVNGVALNSPYVLSDIGALGASYRIVSVGLRIRYNGTELNRGGTVVGLHHPSHKPLAGLTLAQLEAHNAAKRFRPRGSWINVTYCPVYESDLDFGTNLVAGDYMAFAVQAPGTPITFDWEVFFNFEIVGVNIRGMTHGMADPIGSAAIHSALQGTEMVYDNKEAHQKGFFSRVYDGLANGISRVGNAVLNAAGSQAGEYLLKYAEAQAAEYGPALLEGGAMALML